MSGSGIKKVLVTGTTGYVGNYLLKAIAKANPSVACVGMSRRGTARQGEETTGKLENVSYVAGDCLKPQTFENMMADVDSIVHCVGALFETRALTYEAMNTDTCKNMAYELNKYARENNEERNFVMISSAKAPFFAPRYLSTKEVAEQYLLNSCGNLKSTIIKPGVVLNAEHRWWGTPVGIANDVAWWVDSNVCKQVMPTGVTDKFDFLIPARSTQLKTIEHFTLLGIKGENEHTIIGPDVYTAFET